MPTPRIDNARHATSLPLHGLNVVELQAIGPVPFVGRVLQQMGAQVTRILPPEDRGIGIAQDAQFDVMNLGKAVRRIDLKSAHGRAELHGVLDNADVLLEGFRPGVLERLDLAPPQLLDKHVSLVLGRLSGFGRQGQLSSRAGHDINYLALSGVLAACGTAEQPAVPLNLIGDFGGGAMHLLVGVLARLLQRSLDPDRSGGVVDTSILAGTIGLTPMLHGLIASGQWTLGRERNLLDGGAPFYRVYPTADQKFVAVGALENKFFILLLELTQSNDRIDAARQYDRSTWPRTEQILAEAFASKTRDTWADLAARTDCCVSPVLDLVEASQLPHNLDNGWFSDGPLAVPDVLINYST